MIPQAFVSLQTLPRTAAGKVDLAALRALRPDRVEVGDTAEPSTDTQRTLVEIWSSVLGREGIGIHDNFFELGGTSIEAIEFMTRLCDRFEVQLPLDLIFNKPSVAGIAVELESALVAQIEGMSDAEVQAALARESA